ncbi:SARP family transcriptional regulator [Catellatospora sp. IY07-71]|uniref:AfsR/SARP family transcriptional regulator n=1 Tax=Catellatospora sp. IY07-71 TaxID=2728827 RepID=UPI001BB3425A|nr:BTAD domain-containing putative transcriptional regulator [Catellatospora sp. IY07-71]BCJ75334.1 SARP family transcriptional regulator [Catellatospora sp. IY07-71]
MTDVRIQVLGPVGAWRGGEPLDVGPAGQRAVFGLLALHCGQLLRRDDLVAGLWPDRPPPPSAANVIQTYVLRLRRLLEPGRPARAASTVLRKAGDGYRLCLPTTAVDLLRFRDHVTTAVSAQQLGRWDDAAAALAEALRQWQGAPLADVPVLAEHPGVAALTAERQEALARYGELAVAAGRPADGLPALEEAVAGQPLNEAWHARLMVAYQAAGRRGQAFATYHDIRRRLAEELGVDPGAELAAAHAALLHAEQAPHSAATVPAQLPADAHAFTGRAAELAHLDRLLDSPAAVSAIVVSGAPGVGKTALAVHWAHRIASRFPDGQLHLNLRGFDPGGVAMAPADAVRRALDALGVAAEQLPATADAQAAQYRSVVAGRRMLIVLDNARDPAHVRPLLPGTPGCLLLVTSRDQLAGLVAADGAYPLPLEPLAPADARLLLTRRVGAARLAAEPAAVAEMLDRCGGLPLALVILAARAALNRRLPLAAVAGELRGDGRLDALTTGEPETDLRAVFSWSYHALAPPSGRLFRLLGLHPGPEVTAPAAASLLASTVTEARRQLAELVRAGLAGEPVPGRYALHDLVRAYAAEVARIEPARGRRAAELRMLDHYLHTAYAAEQLTQPRPDDPLTEPSPAAVVKAEVADAGQALAWLEAERAVLVAAVERAATVSPGRAWRLARTLATYLDRRGHWADLATVQQLAVAAARQDGVPRARAVAHRSLARAYIRLRRMDEAQAELRQAGVLYREAGDLTGQSRVELDLSLMWERRGGFGQALDHARRGLEILLSAGDAHGVARARNAVGWCHALQGDQVAALEHCRAALAGLEELGDRSGIASTLDSIGYAHHHLGEHDRAAAAFRQALGIYRELGDGHLEGLVLSHLGDALAAAGDDGAARTVWRQALALLDHLDPPEAAQVRARLAGDRVVARR